MRWKTALVVLLAVAGAAALSLYLQAELPAPTGPSAVGRATILWTDEARPETATESPDDVREVPVELWYPAIDGTGRAGGTFADFGQISAGLRASGELAALEVFGLQLIRAQGRWDAEPAGENGTLPLLLFSPGNGTNAEFYTGLAEDLASHGFVVAAVNHPYDVAAVALADAIAVFRPAPLADLQTYLDERVAERAADLIFALDRLEALAAAGDPLAVRIDFGRVAALGHSVGGLAAAGACMADLRFRACGNLDGIQPGGIFAVIEPTTGPPQPFLFMTKEPTLPAPLIGLLEARQAPTWVVTIVDATHDSFTDGPVLTPALLPLPGQAERVLDLIRGYVRAFLDQGLAGQPIQLTATAGATVQRFPLGPDG